MTPKWSAFIWAKLICKKQWGHWDPAMAYRSRTEPVAPQHKAAQGCSPRCVCCEGEQCLCRSCLLCWVCSVCRREGKAGRKPDMFANIWGMWKLTHPWWAQMKFVSLFLTHSSSLAHVRHSGAGNKATKSVFPEKERSGESSPDSCAWWLGEWRSFPCFTQGSV